MSIFFFYLFGVICTHLKYLIGVAVRVQGNEYMQIVWSRLSNNL